MEKGFTLLEILLAVTLLGVVAAMVSLSLSGAVKILAATEREGEVYHKARITLQRLTEDLAGAVLTEDSRFIGISEQAGDVEYV